MLRIIRDYSLWAIQEEAKEKKIYLLSDRRRFESVKNLFSLVDIAIEDVFICENKKIESELYDIMSIDFNLSVLVCAVDDFIQIRNILESFGLVLGKDFKSIERYTQQSLSVGYPYDPILGYNLGTLEDRDTIGFTVYGKKDNDKLRIVTLGGSTTDPFLYPFKCWSEILHDLLNNEGGVENTVFCGGVAGYRSSEELFKLIRDGLVLKPQVVISYSGLNNLWLYPEYPYINNYMREISDLLKNGLGKTTHFDNHEFNVSWGINGDFDASSKQCVKLWLDNQKMMHVICEEMGIKYISVFQPYMFNGKRLSKKEIEFKDNLGLCGIEKVPADEFISYSVCFHDLVIQEIVDNDWIYDMSWLFDDNDVYIDYCHVNERGNEMIAKEMMKLVLRSYNDLEE